LCAPSIDEKVLSYGNQRLVVRVDVTQADVTHQVAGDDPVDSVASGRVIAARAFRVLSIFPERPAAMTGNRQPTAREAHQLSSSSFSASSTWLLTGRVTSAFAFVVKGLSLSGCAFGL